VFKQPRHGVILKASLSQEIGCLAVGHPRSAAEYKQRFGRYIAGGMDSDDGKLNEPGVGVLSVLRHHQRSVFSWMIEVTA
jgi:hypothetical protein